ncbi:MAG: CPBP family intramembrane metalloprotease [Defluviitaleaceae bacterium]|nr:CPBP family intramembrane metalloprotease [Defluviitaleaceae bacterium]
MSQKEITSAESKVKNHNDVIRWGISLALGTLVVLWRVMIPTRLIEITVAYVVLVMALDLVLTVVLIYINKKELKEAFARKITLKDILKFIVCFALFVFVLPLLMLALNQIILSLYSMFPIMANLIVLPGYSVIYLQSPADWVATEFHRIFPLGVSISMVIAAPIFEEISFRMAGRNLIKNGFLYVMITSLLFGFIHTGSFLTFSIISYFFVGLVYALMYLKTKDIRIVIAVHFAANLIGRISAIIGQ